MRLPRSLPAFTAEEFQEAKKLLATQVAFMRGRKLEEGDWTHVYCRAKGIPTAGWSNLGPDVVFGSLGVEMKILGVSNKPIQNMFSTRRMHPAATRSVRLSSSITDPNEAMRDVLRRYGELLHERADEVLRRSGDTMVDMRTGWLLWRKDLSEFLYFEEETLAPDPQDYEAMWKINPSKGRRKASNSLWIFEKGNRDAKWFSVTGTEAGMKIQPYFVVPQGTDPNVYVFRVQGEEVGENRVRIWVTPQTERELLQLAEGNLDADNLSRIIESVASEPVDEERESGSPDEIAKPLIITSEAYELLTASFPAVNDDTMIQRLIYRLRQR